MRRLLSSRLFVAVTLFGVLTFTVIVLAQSRFIGNTVTGQFMEVIADYFDEGRVETSYFISLAKGQEYEVRFNPEVEPPIAGSTATLEGSLKGKVFYATRVVRVVEPTSLDNSPIGEQRFVIALIRFQDDPPGNENVSIAQVVDKMTNPAYSVSDWFDEASYGKTFATCDVFGWFTLSQNRGCNPNNWRTEVIQKLDPLTNLTQYNRLYIMVPQAGGCTWGGLGTLGPSNYTTNDGTWRTTTAWTRSEYFNESLTNRRGAVFVTAHEVGHNFGQNHGNSLTWDNNRALGPFNCDGCEGTDTAYADQHSAMGGGWRPGHHNADHKRNLGWFNSGNILNVTHSGIYEIGPYEQNVSTPIVLNILRGYAPSFNRFEYLLGEWRQPISYDAELDHMSNAAYNGLFMHWDFRTNTYGYNLDMTPGDGEMRNAPIPTGQLWSDQYTRLSIQPLGVQNGKLRVQVNIGTPVLPNSLSIVRGNLVAGGLQQSNQSDDQYCQVRAGLTLSPTEPPIWIEYTGTIAGATPGAFRFEYEGRTNTALNRRVQMFNYSTNQWVTMNSGDSTASDTWVEADVWSNTANYIQPLTGEVKARVQFFVDRPLLVHPFTASIDQAVWKILR